MKERCGGAGRRMDRCYFPVVNFVCQFFKKKKNPTKKGVGLREYR